MAKKIILVKDGNGGKEIFRSRSFKSEGEPGKTENYTEDGVLEVIKKGKLRVPKLIYHSTYGGGGARVSYGVRKAYIFGWDGHEISRLHQYDEALWDNLQPGVAPYNKEWIKGQVREWVVDAKFKDLNGDGFEDIVLVKTSYARKVLMKKKKSRRVKIRMYTPDRTKRFKTSRGSPQKLIWDLRNRSYE